jgi:hypothetical protein
MKREFNSLIHEEVLIEISSKNGIFRNPIRKIMPVKAPRSVAQVSTRLFSLFLAVSLFPTSAPNSRGTQTRTAISTAPFTLQNHHKRPRVTVDWQECGF